MREIGIRELKATLSEVMASVNDGHPVRVTSRGRPVADIVPAGISAEEQRYRDLVAHGRITPPSRPLGAAVAPVEGAESASDLIIAERDAER